MDIFLFIQYKVKFTLKEFLFLFYLILKNHVIKFNTINVILLMTK